jgi:hypothetical protein
MVADPMFPIEYDERTNEYQIVLNGIRITMVYCFRCGGRLPESKRGSLVTTPADSEMAEVDALLKGARSISDVIRILGAPDTIHEGAYHARTETAPTQAPGDCRVIPWKQQLDYCERWESLTLIVHENLDGSVAYLIGGKEIKPSQ